jgi:hypothetical protein
MRSSFEEVTIGTMQPFSPKGSDKQSPFPRRALPQAGESLTSHATEVFYGFFSWATVALTIGGVAIIEWWMRLLKVGLTPWFWTFFALGLGVFTVYRGWRMRKQLGRYRQGIRGEREVGRMLENCRTLGYAVFHDIPGNGFNVDHVLIGPAGVFAVETKTFSKPTVRRAEIDYDGQQILIDGFKPDRDPVVQANASADFIRGTLMRMTARDVKVRPILLFPGWWVNRKRSDCWTCVLNPGQLFGFLENEGEKLSADDAALFAERLTLYLSSESHA